MTDTNKAPGWGINAGLWLLLFGATLLLYTPFLNAPYFSDDFGFYYFAPPANLLDYFGRHGVAVHAYRPGEAIILTWIQSNYGLNTLGIHLVSMAAHASLCLLVWMAACRLGYGRVAAGLACGLMLVTQVGTPALLGNDAMSQAVSAALGGGACFVLGMACLDYLDGTVKHLSGIAVSASSLCYFASLFFKETALGLIAALALFLVVVAYRKERGGARIWFVVWRLLPYGVLVTIYFALRFSAGLAASGGGAYRVGVGLNVVKNLAQFALAVASPISSVTSALAVQTRSAGVVAMVGLLSLLVAATTAVGILWSRRGGLAAVLGCCALAGLFPALVLQHVSELYVYNSYGYIALLLVLAFGALANQGGGWKILAAGCAFLLLVGQLHADRQKAFFMNFNGAAAMKLVASLPEFVQPLPRNSQVWLVQDEDSQPRYSVYVMRGLEVLEFGESALGALSGRPDVKFKWVTRDAAAGLGADPARIVLALQDGRFIKVR